MKAHSKFDCKLLNTKDITCKDKDTYPRAGQQQITMVRQKIYLCYKFSVSKAKGLNVIGVWIV